MRDNRTGARKAAILGTGGAVAAVLLAACGGGSSGEDAAKPLDPNADLSK